MRAFCLVARQPGCVESVCWVVREHGTRVERKLLSERGGPMCPGECHVLCEP